MNRASHALAGVRAPATGLVAAVLAIVAPYPAAAQSTKAPVAPRSETAAKRAAGPPRHERLMLLIARR